MKALRSLVLGVLVAVLLMAVISILLPSSYHIQREVFIQVPPKRVFQQINTLTHWQNWAFAGWGEDLPSISFAGPMDGQGAICTWSNEQGRGRAEIISSMPFRQIQMKTSLNTGSIVSDATFQLLEQEGGTLLRWEEKGDVGFNMQSRLLIALGKVEQSLGHQYEVALQALKAHCEALTWVR